MTGWSREGGKRAACRRWRSIHFLFYNFVSEVPSDDVQHSRTEQGHGDGPVAGEKRAELNGVQVPLPLFSFHDIQDSVFVLLLSWVVSGCFPAL